MNSKELKEYKARLEDHYTAIDVTPCYSVYGLGYESAYLDQDAAKELRQATRERVANGANRLPDSNGKATIESKMMMSLNTGEIVDMVVLTSYYTDVVGVANGKIYKYFSKWRK